MFTGLIQCTGDFSGKNMTGKAGKLFIRSHKLFHDLKPGESIAVNGTCLTLEEFSGDMLSFHVLKETFDKTSLGELVSGSIVNLERALAANDRLGGHIVSGHIDGLGTIIRKYNDDKAIRMSFATTPSILELIVKKGSIAIDGISLTVTDVDSTSFSVSIIEHTQGETTLTSKKIGDTVNLENDVIGKYVQKMFVGTRFITSTDSDADINKGMSMEFLESNGF